MKYIDLRSDTVTQPTKAMREAMFNAVVGDDVYGDDPTIKELEEYAAGLTGKEASLFVPSGTFGNQLALFTHCTQGDEIILDEDCHIAAHEAGASAVIASVQLRSVNTSGGSMVPDEVESGIRDNDIHHPKTGLICLENARSSGRVISLESMNGIYNIARKYGIPVHLDGARLFNAALRLNVDAPEITQYCDSVMFCLSKGLCAPVGSILAGSREFIEKARRGRKLMGGGMRQAGVLAAAGLVALKEIRPQLASDHENAQLLGNELLKIRGIKVNTGDIHINMVFFNISETGYDPVKFVNNLIEKGIRINPAHNGTLRMVTHHWITKEDILYVVDSIKDILGK